MTTLEIKEDLLNSLGVVHFFELDEKGRSIIKVNPYSYDEENVYFKLNSLNKEEDLEFSIKQDLFSQSIEEAAEYMRENQAIPPKSYLMNKELINEIHKACSKEGIFMLKDDYLEGIVVLLDENGAPTSITNSILLSSKGIKYKEGVTKIRSDSDLIRVNIGLTETDEVTSYITDYDVLIFSSDLSCTLKIKSNQAYSIKAIDGYLSNKMNEILESSTTINESLFSKIDSLFHKQKVDNVYDMFDDLF